jgi:hypothetical protein
VPVSDLYIPTIDLPILLQEICGPILVIYNLYTIWIKNFQKYVNPARIRNPRCQSFENPNRKEPARAEKNPDSSGKTFHTWIFPSIRPRFVRFFVKIVEIFLVTRSLYASQPWAALLFEIPN